MTATSQHGFHPDAESLSAFAGQALGERERAEVLSHLAVCGRCRHVVALAREAADAGAVKAPAPPRKTIEPTAWWKQWRLVWVPTAIVAAFAAASISVYIEQADRHGPSVKIAERNAAPGAAPASTPPPTEQAQAVPPASPAPASPPAQAAKHPHAAAPQSMPAQTPDVVTAQLTPEPGPVDHVEATHEAPPLPEAYAQQAPAELPAGTAGSSYSQPVAAAWETEQKRAEEQRQAGLDTSRTSHFRAKSAPAAVHGANQSAPPAASETVTVTAAPPMVTPSDALAQPAPRLGVRSSWKPSAPGKQIHLPSALPVVSSMSTGPFMLAIDNAGTLFLSEDQGDTWERVDTQWTGRAVEVTRQFATNAASQPAPAARTGTPPNTPANAGVAPPVIFELLNDKSQAWVSTDGRTWTSK
jgi:hypothetical protein